MTEQIYTNYRLQLPSQELLGTLVVRDGAIAEIQPGVVSQGQNGEGDILMPGLVELHTDNFERCLSPRPSVRWPIHVAAAYHDRDVAAAGITTVCDAIAVGDVTPTSMRMTQFGPMIDAVYQGQMQGRHTIDHRLHLRCELGYEQVHEVTATYAHHPLLSLISLMDHTPGQRQFTQVDKYIEYYQGKHGVSAEEMERFIQQRIEAQQQHAEANRRKLVSLTQEHQICLASHDDATPQHVQEAVQDGAAIAEFPTTLEAAKAAHAHGLQVLMGAPNLILGKSHSGNVSAGDLVDLDLVDVISSDYVPQSLVQAMVLVMQRQQKPLYEAMRLFTLNPAKAIGLESDRGSLEVGKRADFIMLHADALPQISPQMSYKNGQNNGPSHAFSGQVPRLSAVVCQGRRVA